MDQIIIGEHNKPYIIFNVLVSAICLISSYYYGYLSCGRYIEGNGGEFGARERVTTAIFEGIFFIHMLL